MATKAQMNANRNNAKKSTGPRTNEGKQRSSQNALKHGLLARDAVLPEDPADFDRQLCDLEDTIEPKNALEFELVRQIVDAQWRLRRLTRLETGYLAAARDQTHRDNQTFRDDDPPADYDGQTQVLGQSLLERNLGLLHLSRYNGQLSRNLTRALNMIRQLRADEYKYRENRDARTGGIHRPTVTDPDPYNTPDPYDAPQPARYEPAHTPAAAAAPTRAAPNRRARIGFRCGSGARLRAGSVGLAADVPAVPHASACPPRPRRSQPTKQTQSRRTVVEAVTWGPTTTEPRQPWRGSAAPDTPIVSPPRHAARNTPHDPSPRPAVSVLLPTQGSHRHPKPVRIGCRPGSGARLRAGSVGLAADVPSVRHASACPPRPRKPEETKQTQSRRTYLQSMGWRHIPHPSVGAAPVVQGSGMPSHDSSRDGIAVSHKRALSRS